MITHGGRIYNEIMEGGQVFGVQDWSDYQDWMESNCGFRL
jgi:hypothetical protein